LGDAGDVDLAEDSPTYGQPLPKADQGPVDQNGDASPGLLGALAGAIKHIFGQTQPGQTVPGNSQTADARHHSLVARAGKPEDVAALHEHIVHRMRWTMASVTFMVCVLCFSFIWWFVAQPGRTKLLRPG
jgi:hypothetical protein